MNLNKIKEIEKMTENDFLYKTQADVISEIRFLTTSKANGIFGRLESSEDILGIIYVIKESIISVAFFVLAIAIVIPYIPLYYSGILFKIIFKKSNNYTSLIKYQIIIHEFILKIQNRLTIGNQANFSLTEKEAIYFENKLNNSIDHNIWETFFK